MPLSEEDLKTDRSSGAELEKRMFDITVGTFDRAKNAALNIGTVSTAIAGLYSTAVALVFSIDGTHLPLRALVTPIFIGLAVVLAAAYFAFFGPTKHQDTWKDVRGATLGARSHDRQEYLIGRVHDIVVRRSWALRAAVVALGIGLAAMVLPFVDDSSVAPTSSVEVEWPVANEQLPVDLAVAEYTVKAEYAVAQAVKAAAFSEATYLDSPQFFLLAVSAGVLVVVVVTVLSELFRRRSGSKDVPAITESTGRGKKEKPGLPLAPAE